MLESKLIIETESSNKGVNIHLYLSDLSGQWIAYGLSAYALRLYAKTNGFDSLRSYSSTLNMPCTVVSNMTVKSLRKDLKIIDEKPNYTLSFEAEESITFDNFLMWREKLYRQSELCKHVIPVTTLVSDKVPKGEFIKDGMSSFSRNSKRFFDLLLSAIALILFSPLMLICYIVIKLEDGGPAIYKQERVGRFGRKFFIYKFRSMHIDAEKNGPQLSTEIGEHDTRLTKTGSFLRKHHLDELPQLWNVLCGEMSFIGPRPERQFYINQILEYDERYTYLYQIRPGVTSYATIYNGYTNNMEKMLKRLEYDLYYLGHRSWWFDFKILWLTFWKIVSGKVI